jgi:sugar phosphate isomerase/epimerase
MKDLNYIVQNVQVNIPFTMLIESYLDRFIEYGLNPEIGLDAEALDRFSIAEFGTIAEEFHRRSRTVTLHGPFIDLNPGSPDPAVRRITRRRMQQVLDLVPVFQPRTVVCHANYDNRRYGYFKAEWTDHSLEFWSWMADGLAPYGSQLMLENVFEDGPEDILTIFDNLDRENLGFCLDTGHTAAFGQTDLAGWLKELGSRLGQLHLHDNFGSQDDHLPIGSGTIGFDNLFKFLEESTSPPPLITLEPHEEKHLWPSLKYLAACWPW